MRVKIIENEDYELRSIIYVGSKKGKWETKLKVCSVCHSRLRALATSQSCVDWNRDVLKRELGLEEEDIIDLPILFKLVQEESGISRALAYYPDMVRQGRLGCHPAALQDLSTWASCSPCASSGQHDRSGEEPGHPEAFRAQGERTLHPGGRDVLPDGGPGPQLHLHRQLQVLPQAAGGGALWLQRPQEAVWLQVVEPRHVKSSSIQHTRVLLWDQSGPSHASSIAVHQRIKPNH